MATDDWFVFAYDSTKEVEFSKILDTGDQKC